MAKGHTPPKSWYTCLREPFRVRDERHYLRQVLGQGGYMEHVEGVQPDLANEAVGSGVDESGAHGVNHVQGVAVQEDGLGVRDGLLDEFSNVHHLESELEAHVLAVRVALSPQEAQQLHGAPGQGDDVGVPGPVGLRGDVRQRGQDVRLGDAACLRGLVQTFAQ